jgi:hypothetical protein
VPPAHLSSVVCEMLARAGVTNPATREARPRAEANDAKPLQLNPFSRTFTLSPVMCSTVKADRSEREGDGR